MNADLKNKPNGIILAGGKGIRLGRNKGMAMLNGRPLIEHVIDNLKPICDKILISSNTAQCSGYGFEVVKDIYLHKGPMAGIHACLNISDNDDNIVASVDTPFVGAAFFNFVLDNKKDGLASAPWFGRDHYEPLCAYYNKQLLGPMEAFFEKGNFKLPEFFQTIPFTPLKLPKDASFYHPMLFHNINTKEDLILAEKHLTAGDE
jgi:molybdopterin-guanine dinucleotide biosynthesis protein A